MDNTQSLDIKEILKKFTGVERLKTPVDYSIKTNWLCCPFFKDNLDNSNNKDKTTSLPINKSPLKAVDTIYFYPTAYWKRTSEDTDICSILNTQMRREAVLITQGQGAVFTDSTNLFVPFYRQLDCQNALMLSPKDNDTLLKFAANHDPANALDYYFQHFNQGRPFIIAGHSQGAEIVIMLLEDYFKRHPLLYQRMVAAYPIGFAVTKQYLERNTHLKFAESANDTGVIISYNTEGPGNKDKYNVCVREGSISINPINWKRDATYASREENLGSLDARGRVEKNLADAQLDLQRGVVVCTSISPEDYAMSKPFVPLLGPESYHDNDYYLYFENLKKNVKDRIGAFIQNTPIHTTTK